MSLQHKQNLVFLWTETQTTVNVPLLIFVFTSATNIKTCCCFGVQFTYTCKLPPWVRAGLSYTLLRAFELKETWKRESLMRCKLFLSLLWKFSRNIISYHIAKHFRIKVWSTHSCFTALLLNVIMRREKYLWCTLWPQAVEEKKNNNLSLSLVGHFQHFSSELRWI